MCVSRKNNVQFATVITRLQESPQCQRLPFMSFLLLPFQRITRIKMLIEVKSSLLTCTNMSAKCRFILYRGKEGRSEANGDFVEEVEHVSVYASGLRVIILALYILSPRHFSFAKLCFVCIERCPVSLTCAMGHLRGFITHLLYLFV